MSFEIPLFMPGGLVSGTDLSAAAKQFTAVIMTTTDDTVIAATDGVKAFGIVQNTPAVGEEASVLMAGLSKLVAGTGGLTAGDKWTPETSTGGGVVAGTGDEVCGTVVNGAAAGGIATVSIGLD